MAESEPYANRVGDGRASTFAEGSVDLVHVFMCMTIPFAALKAQKAMKAECRNADFKIMC